MADMNVVVMAGRLTRDPVRRATAKGRAVAAFRIASNQFYQGEERPVFIDVTAFDKQAEVVAGYFKKGDPILVRGSLRLDEWTGKDGQRRSKHEIWANQVSFFAKRRPGDGGDGDGAEPRVADATVEEVIPF